ncbi:MAG: hypothetical protein M9944_14610 [Rhizobiaceae bacterium]|nr:hypothetical protein [Rhizobiaceae bacterium]
MTSSTQLSVQQIVEDGQLPAAQKIKRLLQLESDARALQRAASESPMNDDDGWEDDLRQIRLELDKLGWDKPEKGAASL